MRQRAITKSATESSPGFQLNCVLTTTSKTIERAWRERSSNLISAVVCTVAWAPKLVCDVIVALLVLCWYELASSIGMDGSYTELSRQNTFILTKPVLVQRADAREVKTSRYKSVYDPYKKSARLPYFIFTSMLTAITNPPLRSGQTRT